MSVSTTTPASPSPRSCRTKKESVTAFLTAAVACYHNFGVIIERVMTDSDSCYRSAAFARTCKQFQLRHIRSRPHTSKPNGKAERFIQAALREWAYARAYQNFDQHARDLPFSLHRDNGHRLTCRKYLDAIGI